MLQNFYRNMSISALALAALGLAANADQGCDLTDGLAVQPAAFQTEAEACLSGVDGAESDTFLQMELRRLADEARAGAGQGQLEHLASLTAAAQVHAYDMAIRGYIAHRDPEGRSHLERVRLLERTHLIGAFGANMAVIEDSASAAEAFRALMSDPVNAENTVRSEFDHTGIAAVRANGRIYLVQLFSGVEGKLNAPMPVRISSRTDLKAQFADSRAKPVGWSFVSLAGKVLARGKGSRVPATQFAGEAGYLTIDMARDDDLYTLKGPAVSQF